MRVWLTILSLLLSSAFVFCQPSLINFPDSFKTSSRYYSPNNKPYTKSPFWGIVSLGQPFDSLRTLPERFSTYEYNRERVQAVNNSTEKSLLLIVDTSQSIDCYEYISWVANEKQFYPDSQVRFIERGIPGSINSKDNGQILFKGFPVYILNASDTLIRLRHRKYNIPLIQEALDTDGQWKEIEFIFKYSPGIRVSNAGLSVLKPGQMLVTSLYQYKGDFQTLLRAKIVVEGEVITSAPFKGSINRLQLTNTKEFRFN